MRIYISNILPQTLKNKISKLVDLFGNPGEKIIYELFSKELGIYKIVDDNIFHFESTFNTEYDLNKIYNNFNLIIDKNENDDGKQWIPVVSQLPAQYIFTKYHELSFKTNKKSALTLVIRCVEEHDNFEKTLEPVDFFFSNDNRNGILDLTNPFFQEDFNVFLSVLN